MARRSLMLKNCSTGWSWWSTTCSCFTIQGLPHVQIRSQMVGVLLYRCCIHDSSDLLHHQVDAPVLSLYAHVLITLLCVRWAGLLTRVTTMRRVLKGASQLETCIQRSALVAVSASYCLESGAHDHMLKLHAIYRLPFAGCTIAHPACA